MRETNISTLNEWLSWQSLTQTNVEEQFEIVGNGITLNHSYYKLTSVTEVMTKRGIFYFDTDGSFILLYLSDRKIGRVEGVSVKTLRDELGKSSHTLASRGGKATLLQIYPDIGLAFSSDNHDLQFMEIFPPMSFEDYQETFYEAPLFRR